MIELYGTSFYPSNAPSKQHLLEWNFYRSDWRLLRRSRESRFYRVDQAISNGDDCRAEDYKRALMLSERQFKRWDRYNFSFSWPLQTEFPNFRTIGEQESFRKSRTFELHFTLVRQSTRNFLISCFRQSYHIVRSTHTDSQTDHAALDFVRAAVRQRRAVSRLARRSVRSVQYV